MYKLIIAVLSLFAIIGFASAMSFTTNSTVSSANASMITPALNSTFSHTASQEAIYAAKEYVAGRLGQSYYNSFISYYGAQSLGNLSYVYLKYDVPFSNGTTTAGMPGVQGGRIRFLGITVSLNGTNVTGYIGPAKPYFINISAAKAENISGQYGIESGNATIYGMFRNSSINSSSEYSIAWAVTSAYPQKGDVYTGVYVDAENGMVIGQYLYNPTVQNQSLSDYGVPGNSSLFYVANQTESRYNSEDSQYILPLIIIAFIVLGIGLYLSRRER